MYGSLVNSYSVPIRRPKRIRDPIYYKVLLILDIITANYICEAASLIPLVYLTSKDFDFAPVTGDCECNLSPSSYFGEVYTSFAFESITGNCEQAAATGIPEVNFFVKTSGTTPFAFESITGNCLHTLPPDVPPSYTPTASNPPTSLGGLYDEQITSGNICSGNTLTAIVYKTTKSFNFTAVTGSCSGNLSPSSFFREVSTAFDFGIITDNCSQTQPSGVPESNFLTQENTSTPFNFESITGNCTNNLT